MLHWQMRLCEADLGTDVLHTLLVTGVAILATLDDDRLEDISSPF